MVSTCPDRTHMYINYESIPDTEDAGAETLHNQMDNLEAAFLTTMWDIEFLQKVEMDVSQAHKLISSLRDFISGLRDHFDLFE